MSRRSVRVLLEDMLDRCQRIEKFLGAMDYVAFLGDQRTSDSVVRNIEVIGEAAGRLPKEFTQAHADVPWRQIIGMRHRIVHDCFEVDLALVFDICSKEIAGLKAKLAGLLEAMGPEA